LISKPRPPYKTEGLLSWTLSNYHICEKCSKTKENAMDTELKDNIDRIKADLHEIAGMQQEAHKRFEKVAREAGYIIPPPSRPKFVKPTAAQAKTVAQLKKVIK
jgi:hypothetical protein